jgi:hypothetical protein
MNTRTLVVIALSVLGAGSLPTAATTAAPPELTTLAKARLKAAQEAYRLVIKAKKEESFDPETIYVWSKRLLEAERGVASNKKGEVAAFQAHLDRMVALEKQANDVWQMHKRQNPKRDAHLAQVTFYRAEADLWLTRTKAKK